MSSVCFHRRSSRPRRSRRQRAPHRCNAHRRAPCLPGSRPSTRMQRSAATACNPPERAHDSSTPTYPLEKPMHGHRMTRRAMLKATAAAVAAGFVKPSFAAESMKIGLILPLTGPFASTGRQIEAACRLYMQKNGDTVAGRKIDLIVKDDTGIAPETTKRIAQQLLVQDKVNVLAGFGLTPLARCRADCNGCENADDRDGGGNVDYHVEVAIHRAKRFHAAAGHGADCRMGAEERHQVGGDALHRLCARARR